MATQSSDASVEESSFVRVFGAFFPETFALAVVLTVLALLVTYPYLDVITQLELLTTGFFDLFTLQMALILFWVLSASVVESRPVGVALDWIADRIPTTQTAIIYATGSMALAFGWLNWALGLIGGVLLGQRLCERAREAGVPVHYPLVLTGALSSLVLANQGPTSPGALMMADTTGRTNFLLDTAGSISVAQFVFDPVNLGSSVVLILGLPLALVALAPDDEADRAEFDEGESILETTIGETLDHYSSPPREDSTVADMLERSQVISLVAVVLGAVSVGAHFATGGGLTLLWLLFFLIILGLLIQGQPMTFRSKTTDATRWTNHVAIPFVLYAVVFALLAEAGLYGPIGELVGAIGSPAVGSFIAALGAGLVIPDPGSVWVVLGPALVTTGMGLVDSIVMAMYGAGLSNLWLGFLFAGILSVQGFDWREFLEYAGVLSACVAAVVVGFALVFGV